MFLSGAISALWQLPLNTLLAASGVGGVILIIAAWQVRAAVLRRRARRRPLALVLSDAILVGSNSPRPAVPKAGTVPRPVTPVLSELQVVNVAEDQWGFSLQDADKVILTFVFPGRQKANTALKAMQRLCTNAVSVLQPALPLSPRPHPQSVETEKPVVQKPWNFTAERLGAERPEAPEVKRSGAERAAAPPSRGFIPDPQPRV
jgi:hypothetical protein